MSADEFTRFDVSRRQMLKLAKDLAGGRSPKAAMNGDLYRIRPVTILLPSAMPVEQGVAEFMRAEAPAREGA